ncbi:FtsX-like permease family protein, partial [Fulvivirga sp. RKSG066]|uniref:ABC transporter permease n=1 Tax=Fulvivirga aurantia TaxID=2529383 RepID=UPI0012BD3449
NSLVALQFVLTTFLISTTLLMQKQLNFLQNKNLGFDKSRVLVAQLNVNQGDGLMDRINNGFEKATLFKSELQKEPTIEHVAVANHTFGTGGWTNIGFTDTNDKYRTFDMLVVDESYVPAMKMEVVAGRSFNDSPADKRRSVIVNEAFVESFGWADAIGKQLPGSNFGDHEVIGVVSNFNYNSLHGAVTPLVMVMDPMVLASGIENIGIGSNPLPKLMVRADGNHIPDVIEKVESVWTKINPDEEFQYTFVDQTLASQYRQEQNLGTVVSIATGLAILIGCMGLFALASLNMQNRTKEISIRKVLGASERKLLLLLSKEYLQLIGISLLVSIPITVYIINDWLSSFAYRISVGVTTFIFTAGLIVIIACLTIAYHALKTARQQPAETLKCE